MKSFFYFFVLFMVSCGTLLKTESDEFLEQKFQNASNEPKLPFSIGVSYSNIAMGLFPLLDATSFEVDVVNCASGYSLLGHNSSVDGNDIQLYKNDRSCEVQLKSFDWNGKTWTKSGGGNYQGTATAIFENNIDSETVGVSSPQNLPSPINTAGTVSFYFSLIEAGTTKQILTTGAANFLNKAPNDAPWYQLKSTNGIVLESVATPSNVATFTLRLECKNTVTSGNSICPTQTSQAQQQTDIRVALVQDTFAGVLSWSDAQTAFDAATNKVSVLAANRDSSAAGFNGGFTVQADGPGDLVTNGKMVLIVEYNYFLASSKSYTYFTINFAGGASLR